MNLHRNEYDAMKKMLELTRSHKPNTGALNEGSIPQLQPQELEDEKQKFSRAVTPTVQFGSWTPVHGGVQWSGVLVREKINWVFSTDSSVGCFISGENIALTDDVVRVLQNLKAYYDQWSKYWGEQFSGI